MNCRKAVEEFVQDWLVREHQWGEGKLRVVKVYFPGETDEPQVIPIQSQEAPQGN